MIVGSEDFTICNFEDHRYNPSDFIHRGEVRMNNKKRSSKTIILIAISILLVSCSTPDNSESLETDIPAAKATLAPSVTPIPPTETSTATFTPEPTNTRTPTFTVTPSNTPTDTQTPTATNTATFSPSFLLSDDVIKYYFTHIGTGGLEACGDSLVPLSTGKLRTGSIEKDITIALNALFSSGQYSGYLYNATYPSRLKVESVDYKKSSGNAIINLAGSYVKPTTECDFSRYRAQVWATVKQFAEINRVDIWIGNLLLGDLLYAKP